MIETWNPYFKILILRKIHKKYIYILIVLDFIFYAELVLSKINLKWSNGKKMIITFDENIKKKGVSHSSKHTLRSRKKLSIFSKTQLDMFLNNTCLRLFYSYIIFQFVFYHQKQARAGLQRQGDFSLQTLPDAP